MARRDDRQGYPLTPATLLLGALAGNEVTVVETNYTWLGLLVGFALLFVIGGLVILRRRDALRLSDCVLAAALLLLPFAIAFVRG